MPRRTIAYAVFLLYLTACTTWRTSEAAGLSQLIAAEHPSTMRVTRIGGSSKVIHLVYISGDTLVGFNRGDPTRIAISDIARVSVPKTSVPKTIALGAGIMVVFVVIGAAITNGSK
jgi:hypothetical protein